MTWEEFKEKTFKNFHDNRYKKTDIECPLCGKFIYRRNDVVLTTYPAKYQYECECGWIGCAYN